MGGVIVDVHEVSGDCSMSMGSSVLTSFNDETDVSAEFPSTVWWSFF